MKYLLIVIALAIGAVAQTPGQTAPAGPITMTVDDCANTPYLFGCVNQVNGINVCPYGRVGFSPMPGQPYTVFTYPKVDQNGNPIPLGLTAGVNGPLPGCVWTLPPLNPLDSTTWCSGCHF